jgi:hypothetical protein
VNLHAKSEIQIGNLFKINSTLCYPPTQVIADTLPCSTEKFSEGFNQQSISGQYLYDSGGNLVFDPNKKITLYYNHLNLPYKVIGQNGEIQLLYDANGTLLQKKYLKDNVVISKRDYLSNAEMRNDTLECLYHKDGRVLVENNSWRYEYNIADHLGNVRLTFSDKNSNGYIDQTNDPSTNEIINVRHYDPFGLELNGPWQNVTSHGAAQRMAYNGKELHE